jgi:RHS repeat-associated protein
VKSLKNILFIALALLGLFAREVGSEEAKLGIPISTLPTVIHSPGVYVLQQSFDVNFQSGAAITIAADNVVIDFNGHTISNTQAGSGTEAYGVYSLDRANLTIRNGRIKGFNVGVFLNGSDNLSYGHLVEEVHVDHNTSCGIYLFGAHSIVRGCEVIKTGGSILNTNEFNAGIAVTGTGTRIVDNNVSEVSPPASSSFPSVGIYLRSVDGFVVGNRVSQVQTGLYIATRTAKFRDNLIGSGVTVGSSGGADTGSTPSIPGGPRRPPPPPVANTPAPPWAPPANYEAWILDHFNATERADQTRSGKEADPDYDGRSNFEEFTGGTAPKGWSIPAAGLRMWLRADIGVDKILMPGPSGHLVWNWHDQSPSQITLNAVASQQPRATFELVTGYGMPVVRFDGIGNVLHTAAAVDLFQGNPEWTIFFVTNPGASQETYADIMDQDHDAVSSFAVQQNGTNTNQFGLGVDLIPLESGRMQMVSSVKTIERQVDYLNGIQHADLAAGPFSPQIRRLAVGGWIKGGRFYNGDIAEIIIYNRALTEPERSEVEGWLHRRYNLDLDGMPYEWEIEHRLDVSRNDALLDPDGDGLGNMTEYQLGTDPHSADSDGDGMPDGWEVSNGLNPRMHDSWSDSDADSFSNGDEYRLGTNPFAFDYDSDYDRRPDSVDAAPYDYYNGVLPRITPISGEGQSAVGGQVLGEPLVVRVTDSFGLILRNAPLQVSSTAAGTGFAHSPANSLFGISTFYTDADGMATIYVRLPDAVSAVPIQITAVSGLATKTVNFSATALAPPAIAAGEYHTVALGSSGMVWAWGLNSSGQLGDGTRLQRSLPAPVKGLREIKAVAVGAYHSLALSRDGRVWTWGSNTLGQLGLGHKNDTASPSLVPGVSNIVAIAGGSYHSLALAANGTVYAWGFNGNGQLGTGSDASTTLPAQVAGLGAGSGVVSISAGGFHSLAVTASGVEKGWGANFHGALGGTAARHLVPHVVSAASVSKAAGGAYHTMAIKSGGDAEALGWNGEGQLGDNTRTSRSAANGVWFLNKAKALSGSQAITGHCLAVTTEGNVYSWGANDAGQLGEGTRTDRLTAVQVPSLSKIESVAAGSFHSTAVAADGAIYSWGDNDFGQLGGGTTAREGQAEPRRVEGLNLTPSERDSDQDGLQDEWEWRHFGGLHQTGDGDPDNDGQVNLLEYQTGRDPNKTDYVAAGLPPLHSRLVNLSTRADVGTGNDRLIAGFIVHGNAPKTLIVRAMGPSMGNVIPPALLLNDPQLEIKDSSGNTLTSNGKFAFSNNWADDSDQATLLQQFNMTGGLHQRDAALVWTLPPGSYTAHVTGADGGTGIAIVEMYDVVQSGSYLANLSARAKLATGDKVLISGFIVSGDPSRPIRAALRAIGPSLAAHGVPDPLADPHLSLRNPAGDKMEENDDWAQAGNRAELEATGIPPAHALESMMVRLIYPGTYTVVLSSSAKSTNHSGTALIEVYDLSSSHDTDRDGLTDLEEIHVYGTDPFDADHDNDGIEDGTEIHHGLNPFDASDAALDKDGDGISNLTEVLNGTSPSRMDFVKGTTVGTTQGKLGVGNNGGAGYSIPITVSPGTAGMQPKLSFEYSSRGGNGVMGMGWSIAGVSAIARVPPTRAQDNMIHGVNFSGTDRFAMDGQRLIAIKGGADGGENTEYRTEIESFTRVVSLGVSGNGPRSFKAETKSGLTYFFGDTDDSRFIAEGRNDALSWAISRIEDRNGNSMSFHYVKKSDGRELLLEYISYTSNAAANLVPYARVEFGYESRPDPSFGYVGGSRTQSTQRLKTVTSKFGGQVVRQYTVAYTESASTGKSLVQNIQEGAGGLFFNPTKFTWSHEKTRESNGPQMIRSEFTGENNYRGKTSEGQPREQWMEGDFTGDGRSDFARITTTSTNEDFGPARIDVSITTPGQNPGGSPTFAQSDWLAGQPRPPYNISDKWISGDFDGDGRLDLLRFHDGGGSPHYSAVHLYRKDAQHNKFAKTDCTVTGGLPYKDFGLVYPADLNGDGRLDLLSIFANNEKGTNDKHGKAPTRFAAYLNQGPGAGGAPTFAGSLWGLTNPEDQIFQGVAQRWLLGDVTGDGLPEVLFIRNTEEVPQVNVYRNNIGSFTRDDWRPDTSDFDKAKNDDYDLTIWQTGDFNGDGLVDLLFLKKEPGSGSTRTRSDVIVYLATGNPNLEHAFSRQKWGTIGLLNNYLGYKVDVRVGDFNGDGRSDIGVVETIPATQSGAPGEPIETHPSSVDHHFYRSNGHNGFSQEPSISRPIENHHDLSTLQWMPADFNGDGREDLARLYTSGTTIQRIFADIWTSTTGVRDQLKSVEDAMASTTAIEYKTLTDPLYKRSASDDKVDNAIDLMVPMPVVSSVNFDDGVGGRYTIDYEYGGLKAHRERGLLGFRSIITKDSRTPGVWAETTLRQDFPFTGMVLYSATHRPSDNGLLSQSTTTYGERKSHGDRVHLVYTTENVAESYELNDLPSGRLTSRTTTTTNQIDPYGNTESITVTSLDHHSKTTLNTFDNSEGTLDVSHSWKLGQLRRSTVTHVALNQAPIIRTSSFDYNAKGQVKYETIEPDSIDPKIWSQTHHEHDDFGNTKATITYGLDGTGAPPDTRLERKTTTHYDERGRFARETVNDLGHTETRRYDERWGSVNWVKGPNALETTTLYDDLGRERLTTRPDGSRTITTYHSALGANDAPPGAQYFVRSAVDGAAPIFVYFDRLGRELRKKTSGGIAAGSTDRTGRTIFVDTEYNEKGQTKSVSRPYFPGDPVHKAYTTYDLLGRAERIETPKEGGGFAVTTTVYRGLETDRINPKQQGTNLKTTAKNDSQGHLVKVTDAKNGSVEYGYDAAGNLVKTIQGNNVTQMGYDIRGRKEWMDDPNLGYWTYEYNCLGELTRQTDAKDQTVTMEYDQLGRLKNRSELEGTTVWTYDTAAGRGISKLHKVGFKLPGSTDVVDQRVMKYDDLGRVTDADETINGGVYRVSTSYDSLSRPETLTYPSLLKIRNIYDTNGHLQQIQPDGGGPIYWKASAYDADGHITKQELGNGVITDRVYVTETGVLKRIESGLNEGSAVQSLNYHFDVIGNLGQRTDQNQSVTESFEYDELNRVRKAVGPLTREFSYDLAGNIMAKQGVGDYSYTAAVAENLSPNGRERLKPHAVRNVTLNGVRQDAGYDANGNMTSGFNRTISWTSFNMPELIQRGDARRHFTYNADRARVKQVAVEGTVSTTTIYVGGMYELVSTTTKIERKHYIASPAGRIAIVTETQERIGEQWGVFVNDTKFLHADHIGSVDAVTNANGTLFCQQSFDAWGERRATNWGGGPVTFCEKITRGYTDHEQMDDVGLVHMNGRIYDPWLGRFLSADPFIQAPTETQNFNRYSYVLNNPLSLTDPSGFNFLNNFGKWLTDNLGQTGGQIAIAVIAVAWGLATQDWISGWSMFATAATASGVSLTGTVVAAAAAGFSSSFISSSLSGASLGQAFQNGVLTAGVMALTAGVVGPALHAIPVNNIMDAAGKALGHGLVGGVISGAASALQEGSFRDGFLGAFVSQAFSGLVGLVPGSDFGDVATRVMLSAIIGGTAAELGGGKFANGAISAAFLRLYNDERRNLRGLTRGQAAARYGTIKNNVWKNEGKWMIRYRIPDEIFYDGQYWWRHAETGDLVREIYLNRDIAPMLEQALFDLKARGELIYLETFSGAFSIRGTRGSGRQSAHSYGIALDINPHLAEFNRPSYQPVQVQGAFTRAGFVDGGTFTPRDGMHFSLGW